MSDDEAVDIRVTVTGTPRPIVHPSILEAVLALGEWARRLPSLTSISIPERTK